MNRDELREALAAYAHEAWSGWRRYVISKSTLNPDGAMTIPAWAVKRWGRQMNTTYTDLPEEEKNSDRKEADEMLAILDEYLQSPPMPSEGRCSWKNIEHEVSGWDYWKTGCGEGFCLAGETPQTYNMRFCPFCGRRIEQIAEGIENEPVKEGR